MEIASAEYQGLLNLTLQPLQPRKQTVIRLTADQQREVISLNACGQFTLTTGLTQAFHKDFQHEIAGFTAVIFVDQF